MSKSSFEFVTFAMSIFTFLGGVLAWYSASVKKNYSAQRDFEHLKKNYEQLASNQAVILKELDQRCDQILYETRELKVYVLSQLGSVNSIGQRQGIPRE